MAKPHESIRLLYGQSKQSETEEAEPLEYDTCDILKMRARRHRQQVDEANLASVFMGRARVVSRKNVQVEWKFNSDGKIRTVFQHGKIDQNTFSCDFGYPFCPLQAFALCLGLHHSI